MLLGRGGWFISIRGVDWGVKGLIGRRDRYGNYDMGRWEQYGHLVGR